MFIKPALDGAYCAWQYGYDPQSRLYEHQVDVFLQQPEGSYERRTEYHVQRCYSREQVENYLYRITYDLLEGVVEEKAQGMSVRQEDKELIATLYKYLFVGLMLDWIKGDMKGDPQVMVQKLELVIHGSVAAALDRMRTDKPASNGAE